MERGGGEAIHLGPDVLGRESPVLSSLRGLLLTGGMEQSMQMSEAMVASAFTAPHVTEWVEVDVTRTVELVDRLKARPELEGVKVSALLLVAAGLIRAARAFPGINSTWDDAAGEVVTKHYVNLGIAAATPRGLIVPNIKDADVVLALGTRLGPFGTLPQHGMDYWPKNAKIIPCTVPSSPSNGEIDT